MPKMLHFIICMTNRMSYFIMMMTTAMISLHLSRSKLILCCRKLDYLLMLRSTGHRNKEKFDSQLPQSYGYSKDKNFLKLEGNVTSSKTINGFCNGRETQNTVGQKGSSVFCDSSMKNRKPKHVKNSSTLNNKDLTKTKNKTQSEAIVSTSSSSAKLSLGAASIIFISIFIAYNSDFLPKILPQTSSNDVTAIRTIGGWRLASEGVQQKYGSTKCTITRREAEYLTNEEFERDFRFKKPLIVSFKNGAKSWTRPEKWSVDSLKQEYGEWLVVSGTSLEIVRRGGNGEVESSFTQFVDKMIRSKDDLGEPLYVFDRMFYNDSSLPSTLKPPKYFEIKDGRDDSIFFLGASSSGVSFHKHADAWNGVIYGEKRWFLYPVNHTPPGGVYPGFTQIEWYEKVYPNLPLSEKPQECVQKAGEILYLPEGTYHGTINLGDTVAIGIQRKQASIQEEKIVYKDIQRGGMMNQRLTERQKADIQTQRMKEYEKLHQLLPESSEVMMKLSQFYSDSSGRDEEALDLVQKAIDKDPFFVLAYLLKANILNKLKRTEEADKCFQEAHKLNPNLWDVHAQYGSFLSSQHRYSEAVQYFKRGTELNPKQRMFWEHLMHVQKLAGDEAGARKTEKLMKQKLNN